MIAFLIVLMVSIRRWMTFAVAVFLGEERKMAKISDRPAWSRHKNRTVLRSLSGASGRAIHRAP